MIGQRYDRPHETQNPFHKFLNATDNKFQDIQYIKNLNSSSWYSS